MIIIFRSEYWGAGKTVAGLSFYRPGVTPSRLVFDPELRAGAYKSPDDVDHPEKLQYAFDFWPGNSIDYVINIAKEIDARTFKYNVVVLDNATLFQDMLRDAMQSEVNVRKLAIPLDCTSLLSGARKFNPADTASFYSTLKGLIGALLRKLRSGNIDVIVTAESKNVWKDYGKRGYDPVTHEPFMKIMGQTAKLWDPWFQYSDALFSMSRIVGNRELGEGVLSAYPNVTLDTFNPKCSIPGIAPTFTLNNWGVFWNMLEKRDVPTARDFGNVPVPAATFSSESTEITKDDSIRILVQYAFERGVLSSVSVAERKRLAQIGIEHGLDPKNTVDEHDEWIALIDEVANE